MSGPQNNALKLTVGRLAEWRARPQLNAVLCALQRCGER